jgi:hypothetical protein
MNVRFRCWVLGFSQSRFSHIAKRCRAMPYTSSGILRFIDMLLFPFSFESR